MSPDITTNDDERLLTEHGLAQRYDLAVSTIQKWRNSGIGPRFIRLGNGTVRYRMREIIAYENECLSPGAGEVKKQNTEPQEGNAA